MKFTKQRELAFRRWLVEKAGKSIDTAKTYSSQLKQIGIHHRKNADSSFFIYDCNDIKKLELLEKVYGAGGCFEKIGKGLGGGPIAALKQYILFCKNDFVIENLPNNLKDIDLTPYIEVELLKAIFLKNLENLFSGYKICKEAKDRNNETVILENDKAKSVIVAIFESGKADVYTLEKLKSPLEDVKKLFAKWGVKVTGLIICAEFDEDLKARCENNHEIELRTYDIGMSLIAH